MPFALSAWAVWVSRSRSRSRRTAPLRVLLVGRKERRVSKIRPWRCTTVCHAQRLRCCCLLRACRFVQELDSEVKERTEEGVKGMRALCEQALNAVGMHPTLGARIWAIFR